MYCCRARTRRTYCTTHTALRILYYASIYVWPSFRLSAYILVYICVGSYVKLVYSFKIAQLVLPSVKSQYYFLSSFPGYLSIAIKSQSNYNRLYCKETYTVTKLLIDFRDITWNYWENLILRGIFLTVSRFPLHYMLYRGNLDYFSKRAVSSTFFLENSIF